MLCRFLRLTSLTDFVIILEVRNPFERAEFMGKAELLEAINKTVGSFRENKGIGTLSEKTLHAVLKKYYEPDEDYQEVKIGNYVADIVSENGIIEIQTRQLNKLVPKLKCFLEACDVTVVHPVAQIKYVSWLNEETGEISKPRKSTKFYDEYSALWELYTLKDFIKNPRFHFIICFLEVLEIRSLNGWSKDKKRGSTRFDRIPKRLISEMKLYSKEDYWQFLPVSVEKDFTSKEFAKAIEKDRDTARELLYILEAAGLVIRTGKKGNNILYSVVCE